MKIALKSPIHSVNTDGENHGTEITRVRSGQEPGTSRCLMPSYVPETSSCGSLVPEVLSGSFCPVLFPAPFFFISQPSCPEDTREWTVYMHSILQAEARQENVCRDRMEMLGRAFLLLGLAEVAGCASLRRKAHLSACGKSGYLLGPSLLLFAQAIVCFLPLLGMGHKWFSVPRSLRMRVKKLPMILALHLKRFKYMEQLHRYTKLSYRVVFPLELRLFNTSSDAVNLDRMYDLVAVVVHCGR